MTTETHPIGIMQGRLLPPVGGRIQAFPADAWPAEFELARKAGLQCIEWIYEEAGEDQNPIASDAGLRKIENLTETTGVSVRSICADYYMTRHLVTAHGSVPEAVSHLSWLIGRAAALRVEYIVLPFVDASALPLRDDRQSLMRVLQGLRPTLDNARVELHLETDWEAVEVAEFLHYLNHAFVRANYDIGNSASLGHDPESSIRHLSPWLGSIHVKDRVRGGGTVPLGTGSADFSMSFREIVAAGFRRPFILQVAREEPTHEVELAVRNREFVENHLALLPKHAGSSWT